MDFPPELSIETNQEIKNNTGFSENNKINEFKSIDNEEILKQIFKTSKSDSEKTKYIPFLLKNSNESIKSLFTEYPNFVEHNSLYNYIIKKIKLMKKIKEIIGNAYEIL